jgi:hypothetical protein
MVKVPPARVLLVGFEAGMGVNDEVWIAGTV